MHRRPARPFCRRLSLDPERISILTAVSISLPDLRLLWGRAGELCSICRVKLSEDKKTSSEAFPFGEQAHIIAEENDGPRGKSLLTLEQRNSYHNLILLCPTCHTKIDKAPEEFPVELLHQLKSQHELWFEKSRASAADKLKQASDFIYPEIVDTAAKLCMFEEWEMWTSWALSTSPTWKEEWMKNVQEFRRRIIRVVWPGNLPELEEALKTLSINLAMASNVFSRHCHQERDDEWVREVRFYRNAEDTENYDRLGDMYEKWIDEQYEFLFEATKSANWVAEVVRRDVNPMFFAVPGKFFVTTGPNMNLAFVTRVIEYSPEERKQAAKEAVRKLEAKAEADRKKQKEMWGE